MSKYFFPSFLFIIAISCKNQTTNTNSSSQITAADSILLKSAQSIFKALPAQAENPENAITDPKVALGKTLFYDTRLSLLGNNSCNSCHNLETYGVDNLPTSKGDKGGFGGRNSPTVFNAALHAMQFWDGRAKDVEEQAGGPILNPVEMAMPSESEVVKRLSSVTEYKEQFKTAFPNDKNPITYLNLKKAIGAFERTLLTPSPFDEYLNGKITALNSKELAGLHDFMEAGCITCHSGVAVGGSMLQKFGMTLDYRTLTKSKLNDEGKKQVSKLEDDKDFFKVASLRNVAKTAPYFHDGSVTDLDEAVKIMGKAQLNKDLSPEQVSNIVAFLHSLTGKIPTTAINTANN